MSAAEARLWLRRAGDVLRRVIGVPDYERYVAHVHACHPDLAPMSRDEFARERLNSRYEKPGSRCC
jgi:uncharacterized short protein YbdD (DUF466 family)